MRGPQPGDGFGGPRRRHRRRRGRAGIGAALVAATVLSGAVLAGCSSSNGKSKGVADAAVGAYPSKRSTDAVVGADFTAEQLGVRTLLGDFKRLPGGRSTLCAKAHLVNTGDRVVRYAPTDFGAFAPDGGRLPVVRSAPGAVATTGATATEPLRAGRLAHGEAIDGTICFANATATGRYVVGWRTAGAGQRAVWLVNL